jgi:hypothetical protein
MVQDGSKWNKYAYIRSFKENIHSDNYFLLFDSKQLLQLKLVTNFHIPSLVNHYRDHNTGFME